MARYKYTRLYDTEISRKVRSSNMVMCMNNNHKIRLLHKPV